MLGHNSTASSSSAGHTMGHDQVFGGSNGTARACSGVKEDGSSDVPNDEGVNPSNSCSGTSGSSQGSDCRDREAEVGGVWPMERI